jgi:hypothetical protein
VKVEIAGAVAFAGLGLLVGALLRPQPDDFRPQIPEMPAGFTDEERDQLTLRILSSQRCGRMPGSVSTANAATKIWAQTAETCRLAQNRAVLLQLALPAMGDVPTP